MLQQIGSTLSRFASTKSVSTIIVYSSALRLATLLYCLFHDHFVNHIKFTDIDYHVFTNGSKAILARQSPYNDSEYRYSPLIALIFIPNLLIGSYFGKLLLILADVFSGHYLYKLNIYQGTNRIKSKIFLLVWLFNPINIAISTRGSFEPVVTIIILASVCYLVEQRFFLSGLLFGISVHLKLYPIIYSLPFCIYLVQKRPFIKTQSKLTYWTKTLSPTLSHLVFSSAAAISFLSSSLISYYFYGYTYLEQSFLYHLKRQDLQHNFSIFFYLFQLLPGYGASLSSINFLVQFSSVITLSIKYSSFETNKRTKLRKLTFSLFICTFAFVSLNKVCTSQYFIWYLTFLPLIMDSMKLRVSEAYLLAGVWISSQANWLLFAYLYEYQKYQVFNELGLSSVAFLITNLWILARLCQNFDASRIQVD